MDAFNKTIENCANDTSLINHISDTSKNIYIAINNDVHSDNVELFGNNSEYLDFVETKFVECFKEKGYIEEKPVDITSKIDESVDFVGSKISPLKKYIINGDLGEVGRFLIQHSMKLKSIKFLKQKNHQTFGSYYKCMGIIANPNIEKVVYDTFSYFLDDEYLNINPGDICININSQDIDLLSAISGLNTDIVREIDKRALDHYRHSYGMVNENITGRDFNIGIKKKGTNEYFTCATFVVMERDGIPIAIDMGIGNLSLALCKFGNDSTIASSRIADLIKIDSIEKEKFADAMVSVATLLKENIMQNSSRHFRKKFRIFVSALNYWNKLFKFTLDEIVNMIICYLNREYNMEFDDKFVEYKNILFLYQNI